MKLRSPSHATIVAYLALFTALGGSAYAVSKTGTHDLKAGAVTGVKVKNHSIGAEDLKRINVRRASEDASADGSGDIIASCKRDEQLVGAAGGWKLIPTGAPSPVVSSVILIGRRDLLVQGSSPGSANTVVAQAICLAN
jgi:hypothetical protein